MKYSYLNDGKEKDFKMPELSGGLALNEDPSVADGSHLADCNNMWFRRGLLTTRPGISTSSEDLFRKFSQYNPDCVIDYTFTDTYATYNGNQYRIAYCVTGDMTSYSDINVLLIGASGEKKSIGAIHYGRVSFDSFSMPEHLFFAVCEPKTGCGIYAFVSYQDVYDENHRVHEIYECSSDMTSWHRFGSNEYYFPVLYINGRGNRYGTSSAAYTGEPKELEQPNLLTGAFRVYFSSDGYSNSFQLPVSGLDSDQNVICRIYENRSQYTAWVIEPNQTSATVQFLGVNITMKCDRVTGEISFHTGDSEYAVPLMSKFLGNNIRIMAYKTGTEIRADKVIGSKQAVNYGSHIILCGNSIVPGEVYAARTSNPLYFPKSASFCIGDITAPVTALGVQNDKLIAFKEREMYRIMINDGGVYTTNSYIPTQTEDIALPDTLSTVGVNVSVGCDCPKTLKLCGSRLVWLNSAGTVYVLAMTTYGKENNVYEISSAITPQLKKYTSAALKNAFAAENDGSYILFLGKDTLAEEAFVMDYRVKSFGQSASYLGSNGADRSLAWYRWSFPSDYLISSAAGTVKGLMTAVRSKDGRLIYTSVLNGDSDTILGIEGDEVKEYNYDIESEFTTKMYDFGLPQSKKNITALFLTAACDDYIDISLSDEKRTVSRQSRRFGNVLSTVRLTAYARAVNRVSLKLASKNKMTVAPPVLRYRVGVGVQ